VGSTGIDVGGTSGCKIVMVQPDISSAAATRIEPFMTTLLLAPDVEQPAER
jgi:hypothetical protein